MKYGSVCSGIEAASAAWEPIGWQPQWFSEIEKFPSALLAEKYPNVPNYGDMTKFKEWPDDPIDLLVGGTPCQSFSVAGLRKGLADPRGNLALTYLAIAARYSPKWLVWENVPGVLSSNRGRDFGSFLGAMAQLGYGFAYRVLDAQYFGVAQRRRRVFVVGYLGDWRRAAAVLFERESLSGHPAPSRKKGQEVAGYASSSFGGYSEGVGTIRASGGSLGGGSETLRVEKWPAQIASTLNAAFGSKLGLEDQHINGGAPLFVPAEPVGFDAYNNSVTGDVAKTVDTGSDYHHVPIAFSSNMSVPDARTDGTTPTIKLGGQGGNPPAIAFSAGQSSQAGSLGLREEQAPTLRGGASGTNMTPTILKDMSVRRLTPRECERLQGFPDDYTLIQYRNKPAADGPRYKALGNSMAVPVMRWIGEKIKMVEEIQ